MRIAEQSAGRSDQEARREIRLQQRPHLGLKLSQMLAQAILRRVRELQCSPSGDSYINTPRREPLDERFGVQTSPMTSPASHRLATYLGRIALRSNLGKMPGGVCRQDGQRWPRYSPMERASGAIRNA